MRLAAESTATERRRALEAVLVSEPFRRAEQLKRLLQYLVEQEELGRSHEVTEYELGTRALGRPEDFSPETDSTVRTRMHGLRQKLEEYYAQTGATSEFRIEIPKGTYRPQFRSADLPPAPAKRRWWLPGAIAALVLLAAGLIWTLRPAQPIDRLWQPVLESGRTPILLVGQPLHLWVRDIQGQVDPVDYAHLPDPVPNSTQFLNFARPRIQPNANLVLHPSPNATLWGDAAGAAAAIRFLAWRQISSELIPESTLQNGASLKGRPVLAFGRPEYSRSVQRYLATAGGYTVGMINSIHRYAIFRAGKDAERYLNQNPPNEVNHGLVTVLNDGPSRVFVFSGITSDGSLAGLEYLTSEASVADLWSRLAREGRKEWPQAFQVILRVNSNSGYAIAAQYEKHLVLQD